MSDAAVVDPAPAAPQTSSGKPKRHRFLKWILFCAAVLLVLFFVLATIRDIVIRNAMEKAGSYFLGVPVTVGHFSSSRGTLEIRDLRIANPPGYKEPHAMSFALVRICVVPWSLFSDLIEIDEITVRELHINYEPGLNSSNLTDLQKNIEKNTGTGGKEQKETAPEPEAPGTPKGKSVLIRCFDASGSKLSISNSMIGFTQPVTMPPVHMTNIGGRNRSLADTASEMYKVLLGNISNASTGFGSSISSGMKKMLSQGSLFLDKSGNIIPGGGDIAQKTGTVVQSIGNTLKETYEGGSKIVAAPVKSLKNIFGGSDSEKK